MKGLVTDDLIQAMYCICDTLLQYTAARAHSSAHGLWEGTVCGGTAWLRPSNWSDALIQFISRIYRLSFSVRLGRPIGGIKC